MKKKLMMMSLLAMVCAAGVAQTDEQLFTSPFTSDYNKDMPYRIPAIVQTSNDEILVIADKRHGGGDVGQYNTTSDTEDNGHINLVYKRWSNGAWSDETLIIEGNEGLGYGDAAVVADREAPSKILIMCAAGNVFFTKSTTSSPLRCYCLRSIDGGNSWLDEDEDGIIGQDVTDAIYSTTLGGSYYGAFFSSGRICQSSQIKVGNYYRLYAALCTRKSSTTTTYSVVVYSDDFGENWAMLGGVAVEGGNEAKCEELPDGSVLVSSRTEADRYFNVFTYTDKENAKGSWGSLSNGNLEVPNLSSQATNGEILIVPAYNTTTKQVCNLALHSMPYGAAGEKVLGLIEKKNNTRTHVSIYYKELSADAGTSYASSNFSSGWTRYQVSSTTSAYSSMIWQADGNIGFVWEDEYKDYGTGGYHIKYKNLSLSTITGGAYTNIQPKEMSQVPASCTASWCNNASYSTLYLPYGVELPENVTAYTGTLEGNVLTIKAMESNVVPAYTAVLLEDMDKRSTIDLTMVNTTKKVTDNHLRGTLTAIEGIDKSNYYVLGHGSSHIGFYHPNSTTLKANAAYIYVEGGASALSIRREGATDIEESEFSIQDSELIYDLMGRRVTEMQPGRMYIVNGRKVVR